MAKSYPFVVLGDEFKGKRVLVTGGTKGVGEAIVRRFELSGASVATTAALRRLLLSLYRRISERPASIKEPRGRSRSQSHSQIALLHSHLFLHDHLTFADILELTVTLRAYVAPRPVRRARPGKGSTVPKRRRNPHWRHRYDCRRCEAMLNNRSQYKTTIDGLDI